MKISPLALVLKQLALAFWIVAGWQNAMAQGVTEIRVDPASGRRPISPTLYGTNHRFTDNGDGMWDSKRAASLAAFDAMYDDVGCKAIRYPGGEHANLFEWKKAIGPVQERAENREGKISRRARIVDVPFGLDECLRWAEKHGTEVVYMYNIANGSAQDAADLVEYLNAPLGTKPKSGTAWAEVRAKNGHPEPYGVRYFELGNEMYGRSQRFWLADPRLPTIGHLDWATKIDDAVKAYAFGSTDKNGIKHDGFTRYYAAMKAVDPKVQIYSCFGFPSFVDLMGSDHPYDGLVKHPYARVSVKGNRSALDYHDKVMQSAQELCASLTKLQDYMRNRVGAPRSQAMSVIVTEYGFSRKNHPPTADYSLSVDSALHVAEMLMNFMRMGMPHSEKMCTVENAALGNGQGVFGPAPSFFATPVALAFKMFTHHFGSQLVASTIENNPVKKVYDGTVLKKIEAVASTDPQGKVYLMVINRDGAEAVTANITIDRLTARRASLWSLHGADFTAANTVSSPHKVKIEVSSKSISGASCVYTFPPHSLTSIQFDN